MRLYNALYNWIVRPLLEYPAWGEFFSAVLDSIDYSYFNRFFRVNGTPLELDINSLIRIGGTKVRETADFVEWKITGFPSWLKSP